MNLSRKLFEKVTSLLEKLIVVNKGAKNGQVVFLAGGGASGKGFVTSAFMDINSYKKFDVDEFKAMLIKLHKAKGGELGNLNLKNPDHVAQLHQYVKSKGLEDKALNAFFNSIDASHGLPNILFDITFKDAKNFEEKAHRLIELGYKPENIHIIWVLQDFKVAVKLNAGRPRVVPADILRATHVGASATMGELLDGKLTLPEFNGEMYVVLNLEDLTKYYDENNKRAGVKDFTYLKLKNAGQPFSSGGAKDTVKQWSDEFTPKK